MEIYEGAGSRKKIGCVLTPLKVRIAAYTFVDR